MPLCEYYDCDALIVGGGGAGTRAAIAADNTGAKVALISKGPIARSGATPLAFTSYQAAFGHSDPRDNPKVHFDDAVREGRYLGDQHLIEAMVIEAQERALDLERYGVKFMKQDDGTFYQAYHPGETYPRNLMIQGGGYAMMVGLRKELRKHPQVQVFEDHVLTKLLRRDDEIVGAMALDLRTGCCRAFRAKSVILATGGYHQLWKKNDVSPDLAGDAIAQAYLVGAELVDMEMAMFYPTLYFYSDYDQGLVVVYEWFLEERYLDGRLVNALGEEFLPPGKPPVRDRLSRAIFDEVEAGRATERGTVFIDINRSPKSEQERAKVFRQLVGGPGKNLLNLGLDVTKDLIEVAPGVHYTLGGIRINEWGETNLPGLYAAGEVASNVHGANRVSGNALAATQVFGARTGRHAAERAKVMPLPELPAAQVQEEFERVFGLKTPRKDGIRPVEVKRHLQAIIEKYVGPTRNAEGLKTALLEIQNLRQQAAGRLDVVDVPIYNNAWREALEIDSMLVLAKVVAETALLRQESRGHHHRSDYPESDDSWLKHTLAFRRTGESVYATAPVIRLGDGLEV
jgi:succinate dehydrogenase/fumarate reductase flavoprotein subunit